MKYLAIVLSILFFTSCSPLRKIDHNEPLSIENYKKLEGLYSAYHYKDLGEKGSQSRYWERPSFSTYKYFKLFDERVQDSLGIDGINKDDFRFHLSFPAENKIQVDYLYKSDTIATNTQSIKFKNNGLLKIGKSGRCKGLPFVYFICRINKIEYGLTQNGNLIFNKYTDNSGMILMFGAGHSSQSTYLYQKIK